MVSKRKTFLERFYVALVFFLLYAPIFILIVCSFNASKARTVWGGFTLCTGMSISCAERGGHGRSAHHR